MAHTIQTRQIDHGEPSLIDISKTQATETTTLLSSATGDSGDEDDCFRPVRTARVATPIHLFAPFLLYSLAVGAVAGPKINIVLVLMCRKRHSTNLFHISQDVCDDPQVHAEVGRFMIWANLISGTLCAFSSPRLGKCSDRYGRKPLIAFSALGMFFGDIISVLAAWFPETISFYWILLEFAIGGLTGAFITTVSLIQSYAADCTPVEERTKVFSMLHACMYLGLAAGPALGALFVRVVGHGDLLTVFYAAAICHALFACYAGVIIPESLPAAARSPKLRADQNPSQDNKPSIRHFLESCNPLKPLTIFKGNMRVLAFLDAIAYGVNVGQPAILILYSERQFGWTNFDANIFLSVTNAARTIVLAAVLPLAMKCLRKFQARRFASYETCGSSAEVHQNNFLAARVAICLSILGYAGAALAMNSAMFTISGVVMSGGVAISPVIQSTLSTFVESDKIGQLFGAASLVHSIARALMPAIMQLIYSVTVRDQAEAVFWILSAIFGTCLLLSLKALG